MTRPMPDVDALVTSALRASLPAGTTVSALLPDDWAEHLPMVQAHRVGGAAIDPRGLDDATVDIQTWAKGRSEASLLARQIGAALYDACRSRYALTAAGGYLSWFQEVSAAAELRGTDVPAVPGVYRFQATYRLLARPARTT